MYFDCILIKPNEQESCHLNTFTFYLSENYAATKQTMLLMTNLGYFQAASLHWCEVIRPTPFT